MKKKIIKHEIMNDLGQFDEKGRIFISPLSSRISDLSNLQILHCGVDTVRQMYKGRLKNSVLELFESNQLVQFGGFSFYASRIGKDSGFQFKLQNADEGLILLIKNFQTKAENIGTHLKIECSPHFLMNNEPAQAQKIMDDLADLVLTSREYGSCAVHLCLDVQGWTVEHDLTSRMKCKSSRVIDYSGISSFEYASNSTRYGRGESFMWGAANALQLSIYNKTIQAKATDKLDYWCSVWRLNDDLDSKVYDDKQDVTRIEFRFHQSIIKQFAAGSYNRDTGEVINTLSYEQLAPHLEGLMSYGFDNFKLLSLESSRLIAPEWTFFSNNIHIQTGVFSLIDQTEYKRYYKTASGFSGKNIELFLGNFVSICARNKIGAGKAHQELKKFDAYNLIEDFFRDKGQSGDIERQIYRWLRDKLTERVIRYGVAI